MASGPSGPRAQRAPTRSGGRASPPGRDRTGAARRARGACSRGAGGRSRAGGGPAGGVLASPHPDRREFVTRPSGRSPCVKRRRLGHPTESDPVCARSPPVARHQAARNASAFRGDGRDVAAQGACVRASLTARSVTGVCGVALVTCSSPAPQNYLKEWRPLTRGAPKAPILRAARALRHSKRVERPARDKRCVWRCARGSSGRPLPVALGPYGSATGQSGPVSSRAGMSSAAPRAVG